MEHIILNDGSDSAALAKVALKALREARRSKTSKSGSIFVSDGQTNADGIPLGTGTIINGVNGGVQPWVGDTTPPGKPLGISAESHNGAVWVSWDGTLDGGIPADFDHVQFMAVDGSKTVDMGQLRSAGKVTAAELTAGDTVTITAVAYDDAHDSTGASTPNASAPSDPVAVLVQSAVDASEVKKAQDDAQSALDKAGQAADTATSAKQTAQGAQTDAANANATAQTAKSTADSASSTASTAKSTADSASSVATQANATAQTAKSTADTAQAAAQGAQTTADGKNKIFSSASEPAHTGIVPGDLWFQLDSNGNVTGIQVWNGSAFTDLVLVANKLLVASSVGTTQIADNAITTGKMMADSVTAVQLASKSVTADKADIGSLAAAIVTSGQFQTDSSGARVKMDSSGITGYDANDSTTFKIDATTGDVSMTGKLYSGNPSVSRVVIDDDYNNIDNPEYVGIDGYVAFENPKANVSPFIGGTHGTQTGTSYTGTIMTSGVTDLSHPAAASVQLISTGTDGGNTKGGSDGAIIATLNKDNASKSAAQVHVHSGSDGQVAALMAYDGTDNTNNAAVKVYVDSDGNHNVDIVATQIFRVDPLTGHVTELIVSDTGWVDIRSGLASGISGTLNVRVKDGIVYIDIDCSGFSIGPYANVLIAQVPSQYLPKRPGMNTYVATGTSTWYSGIVRLEKDGSMYFQNIEQSNATSCRCSFTPYILN